MMDFSGERSQRYDTYVIRHKVPFCNYLFQTTPPPLCSQQVFILTSVMHLPYFRMPLSRKKYLCGEKGVQWVDVMQPGWYATSLRAIPKSLLWRRDHDSLLLMYDVNVSAVGCLSSQPPVWLNYSFVVVFLLLCLAKCVSWCSYIDRIRLLKAQGNWNALTVSQY